MSINGIRLAGLRNSEFLQFLKNFLKIIQLNEPKALQVQPLYEALMTVTMETEALFKIERGTATTQQIEAFDMRRDQALNGISENIRSLTHHFDPAISGAAESLVNNLNIYGTGIARENYQSETAIIDSILGDWRNKPALAAAITSLRLTDWMTELATANTAFDDLYVSRTQELAAVSPDTIIAKRDEATPLYYKLRDRLNSWFDINEGAEPYAKVMKECNTLIDEYNALISTATPAAPAAEAAIVPVVPPPVI